MLKNRRTTLERIEKFISHEYFTDVNLFGRRYPTSCPLKQLLVYSCGQEKPTFEKVFRNGSQFLPTTVGSQFGPTWSTHWFKVVIQTPDTWINKEVHFRWNSESEALLWSADGEPLVGFSGDEDDKCHYVLSTNLKRSELEHVFFVEMACNRRCGVGSPLLISPPVPDKMFTLKTAQVAVFEPKVHKLIQMLKILFDIAQQLPESNPRSYDALYTGNHIINILQMEVEPYDKALTVAGKFFSQRNGESQHELISVGHCHIDCAWLWPYSETIRKCARSWASVVNLMESHSDFTFACSQAQQFDWVKKHYPKLFDKIKIHVARGKFIPVGGTWVEMDGNIPSGESFIRQFLYGQNFFKQEFGNYCTEFWLPDTFGYSAQLPQVMRHMGINRFLTQKLSWSLVNKFPHHNFIWEGLDGSVVIVHFPPGDSYEMEVTVKDALKTVTNLMDKGRVSKSMMLFGYGDGGGGPTEAMLERQLVLKDVDGIPKIRHGTPTELFLHLESNRDKLSRWSGELFLELHNATYTTQADMKRLNRNCEFMFHNVELLYSISKALGNSTYPRKEIEELWKVVLLNQFHDVLPGTSIKEAHDDARALFLDVLNKGEKLQDSVLNTLFERNDKNGTENVVLNTLSWPRTEFVTLSNGETIATSVPSMGIACAKKIVLQPQHKVEISKQNSKYLLKNKFISALINCRGEVSSLKLLETDEEYIAPASVGNRLVIFDDVPLYWDAWDVMDYHLETKRQFIESKAEIDIEVNELSHGSVTFTFPYGDNKFLKLKVIIDAIHPYLQFQVSVSWGPVHKFLKVEFPVNVHTQQATYEIQFGHLQRPTHFNTSWDWARYEVCAHKWMDMTEYGKGVAIINNCKYGHSAHKNTMTLSLLRSPTNPDATTDQQIHEFVYAIMPHKGCFQEAGVIQQAYALNCPLIAACTANPESLMVNGNSRSFFSVSKDNVIIESVKAAEHRDNGIVLRLYEAYGGHCEASLHTSLPVSAAEVCNGLEERITPVDVIDGCVSLSFRPFEIISLLLLI